MLIWTPFRVVRETSVALKIQLEVSAEYQVLLTAPGWPRVVEVLRPSANVTPDSLQGCRGPALAAQALARFVMLGLCVEQCVVWRGLWKLWDLCSGPCPVVC